MNVTFKDIADHLFRTLLLYRPGDFQRIALILVFHGHENKGALCIQIVWFDLKYLFQALDALIFVLVCKLDFG